MATNLGVWTQPDCALVLIDYQDEKTGLSAMMRTTAFPASIVALMMARGETMSKGALPQERCIPPEQFMKELERRNIRVQQSWQ